MSATAVPSAQERAMRAELEIGWVSGGNRQEHHDCPDLMRQRRRIAV